MTVFFFSIQLKSQIVLRSGIQVPDLRSVRKLAKSHVNRSSMHTVVRHLTVEVRYFIPSLEKGRINDLTICTERITRRP